MDPIRLILLYGIWIAVALIAAGIGLMLAGGRGNRWFLPRTPGGWLGALCGFILFGVGAFGLALLVFVDAGGKGQALRAMERSRGTAAPALAFTRLDGTAATLHGFAGQVVLVNFWATWCLPCVEEMPILDALQRDHAGRGLVVLNLTDEDAGTISRWLEENPMATVHGVVDPGDEPAPPFDAMKQVRPVSFSIDRHGVIRDTAMGGMSRERFEEMVRAWL